MEVTTPMLSKMTAGEEGVRERSDLLRRVGRTRILAVGRAAVLAAAAEEETEVDTLRNDEEHHDDDEEHGGEDGEAAWG